MNPSPEVGNFAAEVNPNSLEILGGARVEPALAEAKTGVAVQFDDVRPHREPVQRHRLRPGHDVPSGVAFTLVHDQPQRPCTSPRSIARSMSLPPG